MTMPVWGCPWHGLVKSAELSLPNGQSMAWPQPGGSTWQRGSTALIAHPAPPARSRSPEDQVADAIAGRQWWSRAILAGGTLHGHDLGGGCWIYIDPAGDRWRVSTDLHGSTSVVGSGTVTVTLRRFGDLGRSPEEHVYTVTAPNIGLSMPITSSISGGTFIVPPTARLFASAPTGDRAAFMAGYSFSTSNGPWLSAMPHRPVGWVELTLLGPGASCIVAAVALKTSVQTLGTRTRTPNSYTGEDIYELAGVIYSAAEGANLPEGARHLVTHRISSGTYRQGTDGYIVGIFYDESGAAHVVSLDTSSEFEHDEPTATISGLNFSTTSTTARRTSHIYKLDGVAVLSAELSSYLTPNNSYPVNVTTDPSGETLSATVGDYQSVTTASYSNGVNRERIYTAPLSFSAIGLLDNHDRAVVSQANAGDAPLYADGDSVPMLADADATTQEQDVRHFICMHSNSLWGLGRREVLASGGNRHDYMPGVVTPGGASVTPALTVTSGVTPFVYGSWCPVTHQSSRDTDPICYV